MRIAHFVHVFSRRTDVAIEPQSDVKNALVELGCKDEVHFYPDPYLRAGVLRGQIEHYQYKVETETVRCARITYSETMPHEWQRLVCCKELLHVLDELPHRVNKPDEIEFLASKIILPADLQDPTDGYGVLTDRIMVAYAIAVLFPLGARELYVKLGTPLAEIAEEVGIPFDYVKLVMSPVWLEYHEQLVALKQV